jgi:hypothetical protein
VGAITGVSMATTRNVILIGTAHHYQESGKPGADELKAFAEMCCRKFGIRAIGEEMSQEALTEKGVSSSVGADLARTLEIPHRLCDPDRNERTRIGIFQETYIRALGCQQDWSKDKIDTEFQASERKREQYWISQLIALDLWPVLFICGACHVDTFGGLLEAHGIAVEVACRDWAPEGDC